MEYRKKLIVISLAAALCGFAVQAAENPPILVERGVKATMRDGTVLRADIYRPNESGKFPVLLQRTPYNKTGGVAFGYEAAAKGFVVVIQDVRGRYSSEGDWYPFRNEINDGYDTVEWAAALPYSNGKVGMFGGSYVGATQMLAAITHPPHLAGICPVVTASNYHSNWVYQDGAFEQWFDESWTSGLAQDTLDRFIKGRTDAMKGIWTQPLTSYPLFNVPGKGTDVAAPGLLAPYFLDWIAHPNYDDYWKQLSIEDHYPDIKVPALTVAAWYDLFQGGSLRNYEGIKIKGGTEEARNNQYLVIAIGGHAGSGRKIGDIDFGEEAAKFNGDELTIAWYEHLFKGVNNQFGNKHVRIFVMGENKWRDEDDWPLARARATSYFIHSEGKANSLRGDGVLSTSAPKAEKTDRYVYDPANPVPTIGGPLCCDSVHLAPGPYDQRPNESRDDVLVYSTPPMSRDTEVTGPVKVELYASSSAVDTDFTGKLVDVWPNGYAQNLTEGILRGRYRSSLEKPELMNPGQVYKLSLDLWATSNVFRKGHRIRLEISSSNFPRFDRNMNNGNTNGFGGNPISATNTIYHDANHPSVLSLQVVPAE